MSTMNAPSCRCSIKSKPWEMIKHFGWSGAQTVSLCDGGAAASLRAALLLWTSVFHLTEVVYSADPALGDPEHTLSAEAAGAGGLCPLSWPLPILTASTGRLCTGYVPAPCSRARGALRRRRLAAPAPMFSLIVGFWQAFFRKVEFQVLILGLDGAGKTTMLEQMKAIFLGIMPGEQDPSDSGPEHRPYASEPGEADPLGPRGPDSLRAIWEKYYAEAHGLIYVVDATDPDRVEESRAVLQQLLSHPDLTGIPLLVFANKQDAPGAVSSQEIEASFGLQQSLGSSQSRKVVGAAGLTGDGIQESVAWLVESLHKSPRALALNA